MYSCDNFVPTIVPGSRQSAGQGQESMLLLHLQLHGKRARRNTRPLRINLEPYLQALLQLVILDLSSDLLQFPPHSASDS